MVNSLVFKIACDLENDFSVQSQGALIQAEYGIYTVSKIRVLT